MAGDLTRVDDLGHYFEANAKKIQTTLDEIYEKYDQEFPHDDVIDLNNLRIVKNKGVIKSMPARKLGCAIGGKQERCMTEASSHKVLSESDYQNESSKSSEKSFISVNFSRWASSIKEESEPSDAETISSGSESDDSCTWEEESETNSLESAEETGNGIDCYLSDQWSEDENKWLTINRKEKTNKKHSRNLGLEKDSTFNHEKTGINHRATSVGSSLHSNSLVKRNFNKAAIGTPGRVWTTLESAEQNLYVPSSSSQREKPNCTDKIDQMSKKPSCHVAELVKSANVKAETSSSQESAKLPYTLDKTYLVLGSALSREFSFHFNSVSKHSIENLPNGENVLNELKKLTSGDNGNSHEGQVIVKTEKITSPLAKTGMTNVISAFGEKNRKEDSLSLDPKMFGMQEKAPDGPTKSWTCRAQLRMHEKGEISPLKELKIKVETLSPNLTSVSVSNSASNPDSFQASPFSPFSAQTGNKKRLSGSVIQQIFTQLKRASESGDPVTEELKKLTNRGNANSHEGQEIAKTEKITSPLAKTGMTNVISSFGEKNRKEDSLSLGPEVFGTQEKAADGPTKSWTSYAQLRMHEKGEMSPLEVLKKKLEALSPSLSPKKALHKKAKKAIDVPTKSWTSHAQLQIHEKGEMSPLEEFKKKVEILSPNQSPKKTPHKKAPRGPAKSWTSHAQLQMHEKGEMSPLEEFKKKVETLSPNKSPKKTPHKKALDVPTKSWTSHAQLQIHEKGEMSPLEEFKKKVETLSPNQSPKKTPHKKAPDGPTKSWISHAQLRMHEKGEISPLEEFKKKVETLSPNQSPKKTPHKEAPDGPAKSWTNHVQLQMHEKDEMSPLEEFQKKVETLSPNLSPKKALNKKAEKAPDGPTKSWTSHAQLRMHEKGEMSPLEELNKKVETLSPSLTSVPVSNSASNPDSFQASPFSPFSAQTGNKKRLSGSVIQQIFTQLKRASENKQISRPQSGDPLTIEGLPKPLHYKRSRMIRISSPSAQEKNKNQQLSRFTFDCFTSLSPAKRSFESEFDDLNSVFDRSVCGSTHKRRRIQGTSTPDRNIKSVPVKFNMDESLSIISPENSYLNCTMMSSDDGTQIVTETSSGEEDTITLISD